ncbi:MAG: hypothetical protein ACKVWR_17615 [Acidimicrobiales bacterium]
MAQDLAAIASSLPEPCTVEVYRRDIPGDIDIWYYVAESPTQDSPNPNPVSMISWDQTYYVHVIVRLRDAVRRHLCGSLCLDLDVDTCGPAPDLQFEEQHVDLDPCGSGWYALTFKLDQGTFAPPAGFAARCGRVYRLCITVGSKDACGNPGLIWGHCRTVELAVHPPVTNP